MGFLFILAVLVILAVFTTILSRFNRNAAIKAYSMLETGLNLAVGPEEEDAPQRPTLQKVKRNVTPYTKKIVAARQKWICKTCTKTLSADFHVDHIIPLFKGGDNNIENLQALCPTCHMLKSAMERA